ncbi:NifX-associated protein [hydrothermal vent metagenome]|uniref:NifX-associated protein n=1 Tax=hydrothermal vent metagenome TaxID=652676 RepID=A0A3B1BDJ3_9ZZZZ
MSETAVLISENDPVLETEFATEMIRQMRAIDTYGTYDDWSVNKILEPFILSKEMKREIPIIGDPDEIIMARVKAFYHGIATMIEKECGLMAVPLMNLSYEGFGRVIITVGKLLVMDKVLRDVHRFGFPSLSKMKDESDKLLSVALEIIGKHSDVAGM